jgi:hypothetical protein
VRARFERNVDGWTRQHEGSADVLPNPGVELRSFQDRAIAAAAVLLAVVIVAII